MTTTIRVLLYGLEKSGKSTLINSFQEGQFTTGLPSTAQNTYEITLDNLIFNIIEIGGRKEVRGFVTKYIGHVEAIIFVIDGSDEGSFKEVQIEFEKIINHPQSMGKPLAILFHKKDIAQVHPSTIITKLDILNRYDRPHQVFSSSAKRPHDFRHVLHWINDRLTEDKSIIQDRASRFFKIYILDMLNETIEGLPILSILGQLEIISRTGRVEYNRDKILALLRTLMSDREVEYDQSLQIWRITEKGQEELQSSELIKGDKYEQIRTILDEYKADTSKTNKLKLDNEQKEVLDEFDLDELAELYKKTTKNKHRN